MLRPYICVACEKVIMAGGDLPSLIGLFSKLTVAIPPDAPAIPPNALSPKEWFVFSSWHTEPGDELREYIYCMHILFPDGTSFGEITRKPIRIERGKRAQVTASLPGFPIGQIGFYTVKVWIEENQRTVVEPIEFQIELEIVRQRQPQ